MKKSIVYNSSIFEFFVSKLTLQKVEGMQWISNTWETVKRENFLNWFVSPPRKPSIREISRDRKKAKRTFFIFVSSRFLCLSTYIFNIHTGVKELWRALFLFFLFGYIVLKIVSSKLGRDVYAWYISDNTNERIYSSNREL